MLRSPLLGLLAVLSLAAPAIAADAVKPLKLAFLTNNASDFWTVARAGCEQAAKDIPGVTVDFLIPGDGTAATQQGYIETLLAKGADGIAISPIDPANQTAILNQVAAQSILICQDSDAPKSNRTAYLGTDNVAAGRQAGEEIKKVLPNGGKIMVFVGSLDAQNAKDRLGGIKQVLKGTTIEIVDTRTDDTDRMRAQANAQDALVSHPDLACLVGLWSYNGPAIANAVKGAGKAGKIKVVCFDDEAGTLAAIKEGVIASTIVQQQYLFGYRAIELMAKLKRGEKVEIPADKRIIVPTIAIGPAEVDEFVAKMKKLKGK